MDPVNLLAILRGFKSMEWLSSYHGHPMRANIKQITPSSDGTMFTIDFANCERKTGDVWGRSDLNSYVLVTDVINSTEYSGDNFLVSMQNGPILTFCPDTAELVEPTTTLRLPVS